MKRSQYAKSYKAASVNTASPGKLVLMLYDGALRFMTAAEEAFALEDLSKRNQEVNNNLIKAQNILTELQACLDMQVEGDFSQTMYRLYDYMQTQLQEANIRKTAEPIANAKRFLLDIRNAWSEMLGKQDQDSTTTSLTSLSQSA